MSIPKSGNSVALDTNQAVALLKGAGSIGIWITQFTTIYLPVPVVGELLFGVENSSRVRENRERAGRLVAASVVLDATAVTADHYAKIRFALKQAGRPIPSNDIWIAAACIEHDLPLATADAHFGFVAALRMVKP